MSYYTDLGATKKKSTTVKVPSRDHRGGTAAAPASAAPSMLPKILLFGGLGVAALIGIKMLKKKSKKGATPSIALFAAPKVPA